MDLGTHGGGSRGMNGSASSTYIWRSPMTLSGDWTTLPLLPCGCHRTHGSRGEIVRLLMTTVDQSRHSDTLEDCPPITLMLRQPEHAGQD